MSRSSAMGRPNGCMHTGSASLCAERAAMHRARYGVMQTFFTFSATLYSCFTHSRARFAMASTMSAWTARSCCATDCWSCRSAVLLVTQAFRLPGASRVLGLRLRSSGCTAPSPRSTSTRPCPAIYGAKLLINVLFGFIAARQIARAGVAPGRGCSRWYGWSRSSASCWTSSSTPFRGWDWRPTSAASRWTSRAAGTSTAASTNAPPASSEVRSPRRCCCRSWPASSHRALRNWLLRFVFLALTCGAVALTTQKGALVAIVGGQPLILCMPRMERYSLLCIACIAFALAARRPAAVHRWAC